MFKRNLKIFTTIILAIIFTLSSSQGVFAKADNEFSRHYGLIVHNGNQDSFVPRVKALSVLLKYFPDVKSKSNNDVEIVFEDVDSDSNAYVYVERGCKLGLFDCSEEKFNPNQSISQMDFLDWFFQLKYHKKSNYLNKKYPLISSRHLRVWLDARRLNLLADNLITYKTFREFLYRYKVVEANLGMPFREGLMINYTEINAKNYHNLKEIDYITKNLESIIKNLEGKKKLNTEEKDYLNDTIMNLMAFNELKNSLLESPYVLRAQPDTNPDVTRIIRKYNLQEVLFSYSYDYSHNALYRKHNLKTGVEKMNGKVFVPGGVIDYWKIISDKHLWDFKFGWVIAQGKAKWQFGGGICGSSSMVFLPSWKAGLEIIERRNHSQYYTDLYPMENIGLDATVYRPKPNLRMRNNMESPIVYNVINDEENQILTVQVIGNKDYKNIKIEGPIFVSRNHVKWIRHYEDFDGKVTSDALESRYGVVH